MRKQTPMQTANSKFPSSTMTSWNSYALVLYALPVHSFLCITNTFHYQYIVFYATVSQTSLAVALISSNI